MSFSGMGESTPVLSSGSHLLIRFPSPHIMFDFSLYEFENPEIVSYVQCQRDLDITPIERFKIGEKGDK